MPHSPNLKIGLLLRTTAALRACPVDASTIQDTIRGISYNNTCSNFPYTIPINESFPNISAPTIMRLCIDTFKVPYTPVRHRTLILQYNVLKSFRTNTRVPYGTIPIRYSIVLYGIVPSHTAPYRTLRYRYRYRTGTDTSLY